MADNWQETAQLYEQLFQKPKMTEKLLCKPPFRYLHDIFTATLKQTNFGAGLFQGEELNSKSFEDKESKLAFLVKVISLTEMVCQEKIDIKPGMVLAGQQADKTNIWLQQMFRAATSGVDTAPYVTEILGQVGGEEGEQPPQQEEDEGDGGAAAEAEAQAQAQREAAEQAELQQRAEMERAEKEKRKAEKKRKQKQAEEEERQRAEQERLQQEEMMRRQMEMEEQQMMEQQQQEQEEAIRQQRQQQQLIREGEEQEDEDRGMMHHEEQMEPSGFEGRGGALVQEAKALMEQDEEEAAPKEAENAGPKIKMTRIRKKNANRPGAAARGEDKTKKAGEPDMFKPAEKPTGSGGFTEQDIEFMKKAIQVLCQSTNPLGKSIDFVTDDIDSMSKEYEHWKKESQACQQQLAEQQKITEEVLQPLQDQLAELEEKIREQTSKVNSIKSQIMTNDITVQNLLFSVISSK